MTIPGELITDYIVVSWDTAGLVILFERRCLWHCAPGFLRISSAMCSLTVNFGSTRIKCFLAFARKYLPQFLVSILWRKIELENSIEDVCHREVNLHLMEMFMFRSKNIITQPLPHSLHTPSAQAFASFFSSSVQLPNCPVVGQGKYDIDKGDHGWSQSKITAVSWNSDQSEPDLHFDLHIHPYISCILIEYIQSRRQHKC